MTDIAVSPVSTPSGPNPANAVKPAASGNGLTGAKTSAKEAQADRWQSRDGDSVELGASAGDPGVAKIQPPAKSWADVRKIITQVKNDLRKQQADLFRQSLRGPDGKPLTAKPGDPASPDPVAMLLEKDGTPGKTDAGTPEDGASAQGADQAQAPESAGTAAPSDYWSAENTASRIANFAMQFADAHGDDPETFARTIKDAVELGFSQAHAAMGDLPGKAGELNRDTHSLTFKKLDEKLDAWKASLYNGHAQSNSQAATSAN